MEKLFKFDENDFPHQFVEESRLKISYPSYRGKYIEQTKEYIVKALERKKISCDINLEDKSIEVYTNNKTRDPYIFVKACEFAKLVSRSMEVSQAMKILEDGFFSVIIEIRSLVKSADVFERRKSRLLGKSGNTLKALLLLTGCHIVVSGKSVAAVGSYEGINIVEQIVLECMDNVHPVFKIKELIAKKELANNESLKDKDWSEYLPKIEKTKNRIKKKKHNKDGAKNQERGPDQFETGEYFLDKVETQKNETSENVTNSTRKDKTAEKYDLPDE